MISLTYINSFGTKHFSCHDMVKVWRYVGESDCMLLMLNSNTFIRMSWMSSYWMNKHMDIKCNSTAGSVQVKATLQEEHSFYLHFRQLKSCKNAKQLRQLTRCASTPYFRYITISNFYPWKSRARSLGVTFAMINIKIFKSRATLFCANFSRFRDINMLRY